jgi:hypothetical protein
VGSSQHRLDHDRRQKTERRETSREQRRERAGHADLGQFVGRQRAEVPHEAKNRRRQQQRIDARSARGADHHREQHRVQHDTGAEADQIEEFAHVVSLGGDYGTPRGDVAGNQKPVTGRLSRMSGWNRPLASA